MRVKITDGDLLMVCHSREMTTEAQSKLGQIINSWLQSKDLKNVSAYLHPVDAKGMSFKVLSVNDIFEEQILKKE